MQPPKSIREATTITHQEYTATIFSSAGTVSLITLEVRIFDPVKSYQDRVGKIPPEMITKIYHAMRKITATRIDAADEIALERD